MREEYVSPQKLEDLNRNTSGLNLFMYGVR